MKQHARHARHGVWSARTILIAGAMALGVSACSEESIFEGEAAVAGPTVRFDAELTAEDAIHGGSIRVRGIAEDPYIGVDSVVLSWEGATEGRATFDYPTPVETAVVDRLIPVPFGTEGTVRLILTAYNAYAVTIDSAIAEAVVVRSDTIRPGVGVNPVASAVVEPDDTLYLRVTASDDPSGSGVREVGFTLFAETPTGGRVTREGLRTLDPVRSEARETFAVPYSELYTGAMPSSLSLEITGYAIDAAGNCAASGSADLTNAPCTERDGGIVAEDPGVIGPLSFVQGHRVPRAGGTVADLAVDPARPLVYLSNRDRNVVEVIDFTALPAEALVATVPVGSRPWGLSLDRSADTLIVANSGGTSLSYVSLDDLAESRRFSTPNSAVLYTVTWDDTVDVGGDSVAVAATVNWSQFSDRPQHVAQDRYGVTFYSTLPTSSSRGTVRMIESDPAWPDAEANLMLWSNVVLLEQDGDSDIFTYVDSVHVDPESASPSARLVLFDHVPGDHSAVIQVSVPFSRDSLAAGVDRLRSMGSDVVYFPSAVWDYGYWHTPAVTHVTASGDRSSVLFAEEGDAGRAWLWGAVGPHPGLSERFISSFVAIEDLVTTGSLGSVSGAALNRDGDLMVLRGGGAGGFFDEHLRLEGEFDVPEPSGGTGVAMHPTLEWAFVPAGDARLLIVEPRHYRVIGEILLAEAMTGPVVLSLPRAGDPPELVARVHGITQSGQLMTVPVHDSDLQL